MQGLVSSPAHFKAEGTKISQPAQCMALSLMCRGKVPRTKHCSPWNGIQARKGPLFYFQFAWISSVARWLLATPFWLLTNSICTRDATSSHEADGNKRSVITSNKQDAINCLPCQLKFVPWYSMRNSIHRFIRWFDLFDASEGRWIAWQVTNHWLKCSIEARPIHITIDR